MIVPLLLLSLLPHALALMDAFQSKSINTTRGLAYHYYVAPPQGAKPTLLFCHGFPSKADDWTRITPYLQDQGYGILIPDMLGYGGTAKPLDPKAYVSSLISKDIVDVLDAEKLDKVVVIGHDWCACSFF